jgi:hypothetical protein
MMSEKQLRNQIEILINIPLFPASDPLRLNRTVRLEYSLRVSTKQRNISQQSIQNAYTSTIFIYYTKLIFKLSDKG